MHTAHAELLAESGGIAAPIVRPLPEQIAASIVLMIAAGHLAPGQRLVETDLAQRLSTSRMPLREAMRGLEAQGILRTTPYRGTRVASFSAREQEQVTEARIPIEQLVVRQAAEAVRRAPDRLAELDQVLADMRRAVAAGDRLALNRADVAFHRAMCRAADNAILLTLWSAIANHVLIAFALSNDRYPSSGAVVGQHQRLRAALLEAPLDELGRIAERHVLGADLATPSTGAGRGRTPQPKQTRRKPR